MAIELTPPFSPSGETIDRRSTRANGRKPTHSGHLALGHRRG
jgi:hypothetical protein